MADRSHKFTTLVTRTIKLLGRPQWATQPGSTNAIWGDVTDVMSSTVVISTTAVGSPFYMPSFTLENMAPNSGDAGMPCWSVLSVNAGVSFVFGTVASYSLTSSYRMHWALALKK